MAGNMGKWPSGHRKTENQAIGWLRRKLCSLDGGTGGMISANLEVIWEMSVKDYGRARGFDPAMVRQWLIPLPNDEFLPE